jgi:hypothetical protein
MTGDWRLVAGGRVQAQNSMGVIAMTTVGTPAVSLWPQPPASSPQPFLLSP